MAVSVMRLICVGVLVGAANLIMADDVAVHAQEVVYHTIHYGESLSVIARRYGVSVRDITNSNDISNPNLVRSGQELKIPVASTQVATTPSAIPHTFTPASFQAVQPPPLNPGQASMPSTPQVIPTRYTQSILAPAHTVEVTRRYTVRPNDTLHGIAARFGVSVAAIKACNRLYGDAIIVGQLLAIP